MKKGDKIQVTKEAGIPEWVGETGMVVHTKGLPEWIAVKMDNPICEGYGDDPIDAYECNFEPGDIKKIESKPAHVKKQTTKTWKEYQVVEVSKNGKLKFPVGYKGTNPEEALDNLYNREQIFGKEGRRFEVQTRTITTEEWS